MSETSSPSQPLCGCHTWASHRPEILFLTGHHELCPMGGDPMKAARQLIHDLTKALEAWGAEEDGIYPPAWETYKRGKCAIGEFDWKETVERPSIANQKSKI